MRSFQPFPYQGSKRKLAPKITTLITDGTRRLIEPFAGSAAVSLRALAEECTDHAWLNDANAPLMTLWEAAINRPDELAERYAQLWHAQLGDRRAFYDQVRDRFNEEHRPDHLLYLLVRCVKASVRYNAQGAFNQSPDNRRKGAKPATMRRRIHNAAYLLHGKTTLTSGDYCTVLSDATEADVVYMDPPYQGVSGDRDPRYIEGVAFDSFVEALTDLNRRRVAYLLSYDGHTGEKSFDCALPEALNLTCVELDAGRSSQATLLGRKARTYESLYLSLALVGRLPENRATSKEAFAESKA